MITVSGRVTADNTNVLAGTDLATAPGNGVLTVFVSSTQADTIVSLSAPPLIPARSINPQLRTNGVPQISDDIPYVMPVRAGSPITLSIDIVTGATVGYVVLFAP